jgi:hypothetical protein
MRAPDLSYVVLTQLLLHEVLNGHIRRNDLERTNPEG